MQNFLNSNVDFKRIIKICVTDLSMSTRKKRASKILVSQYLMVLRGGDRIGRDLPISFEEMLLRQQSTARFKVRHVREHIQHLVLLDPEPLRYADHIPAGMWSAESADLGCGRSARIIHG